MTNLQLIQFIQLYRREYAIDRYSQVIADLCLDLVRMRIDIIEEIRNGHHDADELVSKISKIVQLEVPHIIQFMEEK